jgi:uncharacterized protein (DUF1697 family)
MGRFVALLRGINVGGKHRVPMAELRALAEELGLTRVRTYVQSGNLVFAAGRKAGALEAKLERGIEERFGFEVPVFVRDAAAWSALRAPNPWPALAARDPANLLVALTKSAPRPAAASALKEHARGSERVSSPLGPCGSTTRTATHAPSSHPPCSIAARARASRRATGGRSWS